MLDSRSSGVLLPVASLPGRYPVGDFGAGATRFLNWLEGARQSVWQLLPLHPTAARTGNSPYSSPSAFALDPLFLSFGRLRAAGALHPETGSRRFSRSRWVDYDRGRREKRRILEAGWRSTAFRRRSDYREFLSRESFWVDDYALFVALKVRFEGSAWAAWPAELRDREPQALSRARRALRSSIVRVVDQQYWLDRQWRELRLEAQARNLELWGDVPMYVTWDSADVWAHRDLFQLTKNGAPRAVAGVPPDYFSDSGQLWGTPLFDWRALRADRYGWWIERLRRNLGLFDAVRLDHFRGFASYWSTPADAETARSGRWVRGPGRPLFREISKQLPGARMYAEDLGEITPDVRSLLRVTGLPGMRVLQFGFGGDFPAGEHLPHNVRADVVYATATHDNNTSRGWYEHETDGPMRQRLAGYAGHRLTRRSAAGELCRLVASSVAPLSLYPLPDVLGLPESARINVPGSADGNWRWRVQLAELSAAAQARLRRWTELYGRVPR